MPPATSVLDDIIAGVREDLGVRQREVPWEQLREEVEARPVALDPMPAFRSAGVQVIAEVKRASPSKGDLADIPDPSALAERYAAAGAAAISVLTEGRRFKGSLRDLAAVRDRVAVPLLRKDFLVTRYQLWEARAAGADLVLLIVAGLDPALLADLHAEAVALGMTPLVEVHDEHEVGTALDAGAQLVGVNARDLRTLQVHPDSFARLSPLLPEGVVRVAESGITTPGDVTELVAQGADVVLVGETLVRSADPARTLTDLRAAGAAGHPRPVLDDAPRPVLDATRQ
jgi:indole-3-glycerol phosphate synthase